MNKIGLIISREYLTRVRKKTFLVMTILGPVIFAALILAPQYFASIEDEEEKTLAVIDESNMFIQQLPENEIIRFEYFKDKSVEDIKKVYSEGNFYAILYIPKIISYAPESLRLYSYNQPTMGVKNHIENAIEKKLEKAKLDAAGIDQEVLRSIRSDIKLTTIKWNEEGEEEESHTEIAMVVGYISGFLIYFFIFLFGAQIMRSVIEEKTSRIVELIISSVKPFQLMMGKIIGVGMVGLTQFLLWVILTIGIVTGLQQYLFPEMGSTPDSKEVVAQNIMEQNQDVVQNTSPDAASALQDTTGGQGDKEMMRKIFSSFQSVNFGIILGAFLFYFLGGYLLYGSLFAAIGSAVDNETDTQQFMLPITIPLILAIIVMVNGIQHPHGPLAFWFSMIPFTSPIIMLVRIPFGVPFWELFLSATILILTFIGTTWLGGKIYRTGILMYGKKVNYKEIWKWLRYHN